MLPRILRLPDVKSVTGLSRSTIYLYIQKGYLTKPVRLGERSVGWPESELSALLSARIAGKSDEDIRVLVEELEAMRKNIVPIIYQPTK
jgi:prophage regulatory protein